ncbi:26365_t:CDS:2, partial [Dentiscutata erythropus]
DAKKSVRGITKQQLIEIRAMNNPPEAIKMAMTSAIDMLDRKADNWQAVQVIIRSDDFINSIVNYDINKMTKNIRKKIKTKYLAMPTYNFEKVSRANMACGRLVKWVIAIVNCSDTLENHSSIRKEMEDLMVAQNQNQQQLECLHQMINDLENVITTYKDKYTDIIKDKEAIKKQMISIKNRIDIFVNLESLSSEMKKWEIISRELETQKETIVGDVLLSASFLAYGGYFDQQYREILIKKWINHLYNSNIQIKQEFSVAEYLSSPEDRLSWQVNSLLADDLFTENAIMLKRFNRYPLIIDSSGQAFSFLINEFEKDKKVIITSFLDNSFVKVLEDALRFGYLLFVQDAEHFDPILNPILNREVCYNGDRVLIRLGEQDIDFSPSFSLFLLTGNPYFNFSPDVCSKVTFVNFIMTRSSLQKRCLNELLKAEQSYTDQLLTNSITTQCKLKLQLRYLEKSILQVLNESEGNILNDDKIQDTLRKLKQEAAEIIPAIEKTDNYMKEHIAQYAPLACVCSSVFFAMAQMNLLHYFYQFSLEYFYEIFQFILFENPNLKNIIEPDERLKIITRDLFKVTLKRVSRALLRKDYVTFAILLSQIKLHAYPDQITETEFENAFDIGTLNKIKEFMALPCFMILNKHFNENFDEWAQFLKFDAPEKQMSEHWVASLPQTLTIKYFRPDKVISAVTELLSITFEPAFSFKTKIFDFISLVLDEVQPNTPIFLCSVPGNDASYFLEHRVFELKIKCMSIAMDSCEGLILADQAIADSIKCGYWVLLKKVHLATPWLKRLEDKLHNMKAHRNFRLFLDMEINAK